MLWGRINAFRPKRFPTSAQKLLVRTMLEAVDPADHAAVIVDLTEIAAIPGQEANQSGDFHLPDALQEGGGTALIKIENLTDYEMLVYHYADGRELEVLHPVSLSVRFDGAELITCSDRVGIVAPPAYLKCERFPKFGKPCFAGHAPINQLVS